MWFKDTFLLCLNALIILCIPLRFEHHCTVLLYMLLSTIPLVLIACLVESCFHTLEVNHPPTSSSVDRSILSENSFAHFCSSLVLKTLSEQLVSYIWDKSPQSSHPTFPRSHLHIFLLIVATQNLLQYKHPDAYFCWADKAISAHLTLKVLNFWKFTSYCTLKPLWSGMGEVVPACTSPTLHPPSPPTVHQLSRLAL